MMIKLVVKSITNKNYYNWNQIKTYKCETEKGNKVKKIM